MSPRQTYEALCARHGTDRAGWPAGGTVAVAIRCRQRGHPLARVYVTPTGYVLVVRYTSGRRTRRVASEVVSTLKYASFALYDADAPDLADQLAPGRVRADPRGYRSRVNTKARCRCTETLLDAAAIRSGLAAFRAGKRCADLLA